MSNTSIQLKKSGATGNTPSGLAFGEVALNYADGKLYYKNALGGTSYISNQFSFDTINANNSLILATGVSDTLSFVAGNNISISTNTTSKTITINSTGTATDQFARDTANSAGSYANAAFNKANTYPGNPNQVLYKNSGNVLTSSSGLVYDGAHLKVNGNLESTYSSGDEGGEIFLSKSVTNTTLAAGVTIDVYQNRFRIFESGGSNRGVYIDMANGATSGIGVNLLSPPGGSVTSVAGATGTVSNTQLIAGIQSVSSSYGITFDYVATANNGQGTNFKVGDDAWIGDYNVANAIKIKGQQDAANGYISFGSNTSRLGVAGAGQLTYGDNTVWHAGNDGAGSGLDADLLDGLNSSAFARDSAESYANSAFLAANTADSKSVTVGSYANSAYTQANTATNNAAGASLYANGAFAQANAAFTRANSVTSGFRSNTVIIANSTGFLSNSNAEFSLANNTLYVPNANVSSELTANSLVFYDGTRLNSATGISANTANSAATANVSIFARVTNVTTGTYFPIVTDTTVTGADTFHYSSNDFLMYAANNTFRASGNLWAGQFLTVGTNIPVVNSTGHWVGQTINAVDQTARTTSTSAFVQANAAFTTANAALPSAGGTVTGNLTLSTTATMIIQNTRPTTSNSTGALIVRGGVGIAGNLFVGGIFTVDGDFQVGNTTSTGNVFNSGFVTFSQPTQFTSNAATTSNTTGAIIATGGISTRGNIFSGAIRITGSSSNGLTFSDGTIQYTANAPASSIANGSSNITIQTVNGNIVTRVNGVAITTVSNNGIQLSTATADITGANNIYATTFIANNRLSVAGSGGDITGANNIFASVMNVTTASIVAGINVVPYIESAFIQANAAFAAANLASSNVYSFVGTGSCTSFTLSTTNNPSSNTIIVNVDGVIQLHSTYDVTSNVINFTEAPASNAEIEVQIIAGASGSPNSLTLTPEVNTTSGTSVVLTTAIPSWAKRITVNFYGISLSGTQIPLIQFGTGATPTWATSGYDSSADNYATTAGPVVGSTAGFIIGSGSSAAQTHNGAYTFTLVGSNKWVGTLNGNIEGGVSVLFGGGRVALSGQVTAIRLFSNGGTNTYDAGSASVMYE